MRYRVFFSCWLALASCISLADSAINVASLQRGVAAFLQEALSGAYPGVTTEDMEIAVANLDPRLKLQPCDAPVQHSLTSQPPYGTNVSVKVHCPGSRPWTLYVPARVDTYALVVVTTRSLSRGTQLSEADVSLTRMNTAQAGYNHLQQLDQVVGKELRRHLRAGEPLRLSHLKSPLVVRRGERVVMEAGGAAVSVVTSGRALANGQVGDQIRVQNEQSQRVVEAEIIAPGRVRVAL